MSCNDELYGNAENLDYVFRVSVNQSLAPPEMLTVF